MATGHILIADDDAAIRTVLSQALTRAGYDVRVTGMATTLWRWVQAGDGDLVITDVVMPDENAFEILPRMKKLRPELPIIVMSAQNTFMTAIKASERGAYDYLPKPFDLKELVAIVGRALLAFGAGQRGVRVGCGARAPHPTAGRQPSRAGGCTPSSSHPGSGGPEPRKDGSWGGAASTTRPGAPEARVPRALAWACRGE